MKSILIKIGKSAKVIRQEGLILGGKRVLDSWIGFMNMNKKVQPGDILFIAGGAMGDSTFYRVHNQAEELRLNNFNCSVTAQDSPWLVSYANEFKIFIFHRVLYTEKVSKLIEEIKKNNGEIIFETDDLVYDPKYLGYMDFFKKMNAFEKMLYKNGLGGEILNDPYVKTCVTSTSYLSEKLKEKGKNVIVSKNKISNHELEVAENVLKNKKKIDDGFIRIGYYSGTLSHNKDFATVSDALLEVFRKYKKAKLILAGPLDVEDRLNEFKDRIEVLPRVSRDKYYENLYLSDINLAPLEFNNPFCEAKSEIKFIEPGIIGVPTVAVRNQTFSEAIEDGVDGFLAGNTAEWIERISKLIEDENLRKSIGEKAREKVLRDYTNKNSHNGEYYNYLA